MTANLNHQRRSADRDSEDSISSLVIQGAARCQKVDQKQLKLNVYSCRIVLQYRTGGSE